MSEQLNFKVQPSPAIEPAKPDAKQVLYQRALIFSILLFVGLYLWGIVAGLTDLARRVSAQPGQPAV